MILLDISRKIKVIVLIVLGQGMERAALHCQRGRALTFPLVGKIGSEQIFYIEVGMSYQAVSSSSVGGGRTAGIAQGLAVALAGFFPVMAIVSLAPAVPTLLAHFSHVPSAQTIVPMIVTAPGLMIALLSPFAGWAVDRFGRRRLILSATLFYGIFGAFPFLIGSLSFIFAARLALGITEAAILTVTNVLIADYFDAAGRRLWLTVQAVLGPILGVATITSSGLLTSNWWNGAFLIYLIALPMFFFMFFAIFEPRPILQQTDERQDQLSIAFPWSLVMRFVPLTIFAGILYYVFIVQGGLAYQEIGLTDAGSLGGLLALASIGVPIGGVMFGYISKRTGVGRLLAIMFLMLGLGMIVIGIARTIPFMVFGSFIQQIGAGMCVSSLIYWVSSLLPASHRGRGFGIWNSAFFMGQFLSPAIAGPLHSQMGGIQPVFILMGMLSIVGAGTLVVAGRKLTTAPAS